MKDWEYIKNPSFRQKRPSPRPPIAVIKTPEQQRINPTPTTLENKLKEISTSKWKVKWTFSMSSDVGNIRLEVDDETTYDAALTLLKAIRGLTTDSHKESELKRGSDYESK